MTTFPIYQVDAFTDKLFGGNPAAICPLDTWLPEATLQQVAAENNLSETAFIVPQGDDFQIRWFTPTVEVDLCGHATVAAAHVLFNHRGYTGETIVFHSKSGPLPVVRNGDKLRLDFPSHVPFVVYNPPAEIRQALNLPDAIVYKGPFDYLVIVEDQELIEGLQPDFRLLAQVKSRGVVVTAPGKDSDFVSRCFYPQSGIDEDPVTGSAHTMLTPYWSARFGKTNLSAIQLSSRRGHLDCELHGDRVYLSGRAVTFLAGEITLP